MSLPASRPISYACDKFIVLPGWSQWGRTEKSITRGEIIFACLQIKN